MPIDPAEKDVEEYKRILRASESLPGALVDLACLLLDRGSMEEACRSSWFCDDGDDGLSDVDGNLDRLRQDAWASLGAGGQSILRRKGVSVSGQQAERA